MQPIRFGWNYIFKGPKQTVEKLGQTFTRGLKGDNVTFTQQPIKQLSGDKFELRLSTPSQSFTQIEFLNLLASITNLQYPRPLRNEVWKPALKAFTAPLDKAIGELVDPKAFEEVTIELPHQ